MFRPWNLFHKPDRFLKALLDTQGDPSFIITDDEVHRQLRLMRIKRRLREPFNSIWRFIHGQYRRAREKIHRHSDQASGAGPRATSATGSGASISVAAVPHFSSPGSGFSASVAITPGQGAGGGGGGGPTSGSVMQTTFTLSAPTGVYYGPAIEFEDVPDAGVRTGEIIAYRCWRLNVFDDLTSVHMTDVVWPRNEPLRASDVDFKLSHGIHAFKDFLDMYSYAQSYFRCSPVGAGIIVTGKVELWGQIIEHDRGYLAEFAAVHSIDDSPHYDANTIRKAYGLKIPRKKKAK